MSVTVLVLLAILPKVGEPFIVCAAVGLVVVQVAGSRVSSQPLHLPVLLLLLLAWTLLSVVWSINPISTVAATVKVFGFVFVACMICVDRSVADIARLVTVVGKLLLASSWVLFVVWPSVGQTVGGYEAGTVQGVFVHRNQFGYMAVIFAISLAALPWLQPLSQSRRINTRTTTAWTALAVVSIFASSSRTGWLMAFVAAGMAVALLGVRALKDARGLVARALGVALLLAIPTAALTYSTVALAVGRDATLTGRTDAWAPIWHYVQEAPILGYGWGAVWPSSDLAQEIFVLTGYEFPNAHNAYLDVAIQLGFVGLALSSLYLVATVGRGLVRFSQAPDAAHGWLIITLVTMLGYSFTESFAFTNFSFVLIVMMSVALVARGRSVSSERSLAGP